MEPAWPVKHTDPRLAIQELARPQALTNFANCQRASIRKRIVDHRFESRAEIAASSPGVSEDKEGLEIFEYRRRPGMRGSRCALHTSVEKVGN